MRYSLRQLEVFLATAHFENITRAAKSLAMSQSAASGSLRELESQFDVQLFDRVGKRLQLSELGLQVRPEVESLLARAQALEESLAGEAVAGHLKIGATLTIGNYLAVGMIADFKRRFPSADIALSVANTRTIAEQVQNFELDIGLIEGELSASNLETRLWRPDELVVFAAPGQGFKPNQRLTDTQLLAQPWIVRESGSGTRQTFERAMHGILSKLDLSMELQHTEAIKRAVEAGLGLGCLSRICLRDAFSRGSLIPLAVPERDFSRHFHIITHRQKYHSSAVQEWLALCQGVWRD